MVKVKVKYLIQKEIVLESTTREWCEIHADKTELVKLLAEEDGVNVDDVIIQDDYCDIIEGELNYKDLDK